MNAILSTGTALVVVMLMFAGDLSAKDDDKKDGNRGKESRSGSGSGGGQNRSGSDRGGSDKGGSGSKNSDGFQNQFNKAIGEGTRSEGSKKFDQNDFRPKPNSGKPNGNPSDKFNQGDRNKSDNFNRGNDGNRDNFNRDNKTYDNRNRDNNSRDGKGGKYNDNDRRDYDHRDNANHRNNNTNWKSWNKDGWSKDNWHTQYNNQHRQHNHGYWYGGTWYPPLFIVQRQPIVYLQPRTQLIVGQKWLGVTYEPYDGGGAYVTGIYRGSPAEQLGLEVGDVIVTIDGRDAANLPAAIQASNGIIDLQVLRGRTGELAAAQVNIIR